MKNLLSIILFLMLPLGVVAQLNTDRLTGIGRNALYFEDYVLSIQYFNQVVKSKPFLSEPYFYRAIAKIQLEDYIGAEQDLNKVIELNPFIPMAYYARGFSRRRLDNLVGAMHDFSSALNYSPENPLYIINRIEVYEQLKQFDESISDIDFLIRRSPNQTGLYLEKGRVLLSKGDTISAKDCFYKGVEIDALDPDMWGAKAYYMMLVENRDSALMCYDKAVDLNSENISTYINRGILYYHKKNYRVALEDYDVAVKLDPYNVQALYNRALMRSEVGDYNTALADLESIMKLDPSFSEALYQSAVIHIELNQWTNAIDELTKLIDRHRFFAPALYLRANVYEKMGKDKLAYLDRDAAYKLKEQYRNQSKSDSLNTDIQVADQYNSSISKKSAIFLANVNSDVEDDKSIKGAVQNKEVNVTNEDNFQLSYYNLITSELPQQMYLTPEIQKFNQSKRFDASLYIVNNEVPMSNSLIKFHFDAIVKRTQILDREITNADEYFERAMDYVLVKDYSSAISDLSKAIYYGKDMALAYFARANARYKLIEVSQSKLDIEDNIVSSSFGLDRTDKNDKNLNVGSLFRDNKQSIEYEMVMRDYDMVIDLAPDFPYAWFNKANLLSLQRDYDAAIKNYTKAIEIHSDFGEAYFNRALLYILLDRTDEAILDLSKAGELGMYKSYSIIKQLSK